MSETIDKSGRGNSDVIIGEVTVHGRWRYKANQTAEQPDGTLQIFVGVTLKDRKKLTNLKKGDHSRLTAGPFQELPVILQDLEYHDGKGWVVLAFASVGEPA